MLDIQLILTCLQHIILGMLQCIAEINRMMSVAQVMSYSH